MLEAQSLCASVVCFSSSFFVVTCYCSYLYYKFQFSSCFCWYHCLHFVAGKVFLLFLVQKIILDPGAHFTAVHLMQRIIYWCVESCWHGNRPYKFKNLVGHTSYLYSAVAHAYVVSAYCVLVVVVLELVCYCSRTLLFSAGNLISLPYW